mgnify:CR=1 FL=1
MSKSLKRRRSVKVKKQELDKAVEDENFTLASKKRQLSKKLQKTNIKNVITIPKKNNQGVQN